MSWITKFPWLSFTLLLLSYAVFGWYISASGASWSHFLAEQGKGWGWLLNEDSLYIAIHLLATLTLVGISLLLTAPIMMMTYFLDSWLQSNVKSVLSMLAWSFAFVIIIHWFDYFTRFLVLLSAAILGRVEIQAAGFNRWQTAGLLTILCVTGFGLGVLGYLTVNHRLLTINN